MSQYPEAIIFDLDGVITDTAEFHFIAWKKIARELGVEIDRAFNERLKGVSRMESLEEILSLDPELMALSMEEKTRYATKKNEDYKLLIETITPEHILPGIKQLLIEIKEKKIKTAIASASHNAPSIIERLELAHYFDHCVDVSKIKHGKPNPEIFITAAEKLKVFPENCIGIEDAIAGVDAINSAQMFSVGVGSKDQLAKADVVVSETAELMFDDLVNEFHQWKKK